MGYGNIPKKKVFVVPPIPEPEHIPIPEPDIIVVLEEDDKWQ